MWPSLFALASMNRRFRPPLPPRCAAAHRPELSVVSSVDSLPPLLFYSPVSALASNPSRPTFVGDKPDWVWTDPWKVGRRFGLRGVPMLLRWDIKWTLPLGGFEDGEDDVGDKICTLLLLMEEHRGGWEAKRTHSSTSRSVCRHHFALWPRSMLRRRPCCLSLPPLVLSIDTSSGCSNHSLSESN